MGARRACIDARRIEKLSRTFWKTSGIATTSFTGLYKYNTARFLRDWRDK
jgi:hypothetical protein